MQSDLPWTEFPYLITKFYLHHMVKAGSSQINKGPNGAAGTADVRACVLQKTFSFLFPSSFFSILYIINIIKASYT